MDYVAISSEKITYSYVKMDVYAVADVDDIISLSMYFLCKGKPKTRKDTNMKCDSVGLDLSVALSIRGPPT